MNNNHLINNNIDNNIYNNINNNNDINNNDVNNNDINNNDINNNDINNNDNLYNQNNNLQSTNTNIYNNTYFTGIFINTNLSTSTQINNPVNELSNNSINTELTNPSIFAEFISTNILGSLQNEINQQNDEEQNDEEQNDEEQNDEEQGEENIPNIFNIGGNFTGSMNLSDINGIVDNKMAEILNWTYENMMNVDDEIIKFIDFCYLKNLQYDDEPIDTIRYTIRTVFHEGRRYELKNLSSNIFAYSMIGVNVVFNENFELLNELLVSELKRYIRQGLSLQIFSQMIAGGIGGLGIFDSAVGSGGFGQMEDVKLILTPEELEKIPSKSFKDLEPNLAERCDKCPVCRDEFRDNDIIRVLNCEHIFHTDCIDNWLTQHSHKCPCCRKEAGIHKANI